MCLQKLTLFLDFSLKNERVNMIGSVDNQPCKSRCDLSAKTTRAVGMLCGTSPQNLRHAGFHASPVWISPKSLLTPSGFPVSTFKPSAKFSIDISLSSGKRDTIIASKSNTATDATPPLDNFTSTSRCFNLDTSSDFSSFGMKWVTAVIGLNRLDWI